jgi:UDPglucose--hexose-1-phosphate uridylyltransferase
MAELRRDPLTGRSVILAASRAARPHDLAAPAATSEEPAAEDEVVADCPFCPGHEDRTPPEVARVGPGAPDSTGWQVRVVPNLYPFVGGADGEASAGDELRRHRPAGGSHEVAVLSPSHHRPLGRLDDGQVLLVLRALQERVRVHAAAGLPVTQVMVNHGAGGGASLAHPHAQLVAIDLVPPLIEQEVAHLAPGGGCVLCRELERHRGHDPLDVAGGDAPLWCPWWSSTPYELLLAPRHHRARFEDAGDELGAVATTLREGLARLDARLGDPPYNVILHTLPDGLTDDFHWHLHVRPRLQVEAGFELGTGILVNTLAPEVAARSLR